MRQSHFRRPALALLVLGLAASVSPAQAAIFDRSPKIPAATMDGAVSDVQQAIDEQRYVDAGRMLDKASLAGLEDPRFVLLAGELNLARGRYAQALSDFKRASVATAVRARALQGEGIALSQLGRSDEAMDSLRQAVAEDPTAWRAWNALGGAYDHRRDWAGAEEAYANALTHSKGAAIVFNNRGYSRLLQNRPDDAIPDLLAALEKRPDLVQARTNLRLSLAMKGEYDRAVAGGAHDDEAMLLNNAGFAAGLRGDYAEAEDMLNRAMKLRSEYYTRASENLKLVQGLAKRAKPDADVAR